MATIITTIKSLPNMLPLKGATNTEITDAELQLRTSFAVEYKEYLSAFGAVMADGIELTGIAKSDHRSVVSVTKQARDLNPDVPYAMYVVEDAGIDGIIVWQDSSGAVYQSAPNVQPKQIAKTLVDYLTERIG